MEEILASIRRIISEDGSEDDRAKALFSQLPAWTGLLNVQSRLDRCQ